MSASIHPLNKNRHASTRLRDASPFEHVQAQHMVPIVLHEFVRLAAEYPLGFVKNSETGQFQPVAILGLSPGENLFFSASGWRSDQVPGFITHYPLMLTPDIFNPDQLVVAINESSELVGEGNLLFTELGDETPYLQQRKKSLVDYYEKDVSTKSIVEFLAKKKLLKQQSINVQLNGQNFVINGVYIIDEQLLQQLDHESFLELRDRGLLPAIYSQLASIHQLQKLIRLKADTHTGAIG